MYSEPPPPSTRFTALAWAPLVALLGLFAVALWEYDPAAFVGDAAIVSLSQSAMCRGETGVKATRTFPSFLAANASQSSRMPAASRRREPPIFLAAVAVCQEPASVLSWVEKLCRRPDPRRGEWRVTIYHQCDENNFGTLPSPNLRRSGHLGTAHALAELNRASSGGSGSGGARWPSFNRFNRTWPSGPCIQHMWNRSVGTGREQEAYLSHILRHYHSLEGNRDHSNNPRLTRRLHLQQEHQASKEQEAEKQRQQQQKQRFAQVEHKQQEQQLEQKQGQQQDQRRQLGRSKGWRLGQSALNSHSSPTSGGGSHGHLHGLGRTYLVFLQADAPLEFQLPPFAGDPAAALEAMAAADDDGNDDDDGGNGKGDRRNDGSSSSSSASSSSSSSESRRGSSARSSSSRSNRRDASSSSSSAGVLGYASLTGTAFRTPPPQGFRKRVAATWLNPVDNRAPRARYLCRWSPVQLAMQAASGMHSGASSLTPPFFSTAANASANAISSLSAPSPSFTSSPAAPQSLPPLSRWASEDKEVDCRRAYLTPSRAQFVASPSRVKALPYETWEALHALSVTSTGVATDPFEHSWAALFGCILPADCPRVVRLLSQRHSSPVGLECRD